MHEYARSHNWEREMRYFSRGHRCIAIARGSNPSMMPSSSEGVQLQELIHRWHSPSSITSKSQRRHSSVCRGVIFVAAKRDDAPERALSMTRARRGSVRHRKTRQHPQAVPGQSQNNMRRRLGRSAKRRVEAPSRIPFLLKAARARDF